MRSRCVGYQICATYSFRLLNSGGNGVEENRDPYFRSYIRTVRMVVIEAEVEQRRKRLRYDYTTHECCGWIPHPIRLQSATVTFMRFDSYVIKSCRNQRNVHWVTQSVSKAFGDIKNWAKTFKMVQDGTIIAELYFNTLRYVCKKVDFWDLLFDYIN